MRINHGNVTLLVKVKDGDVYKSTDRKVLGWTFCYYN